MTSELERTESRLEQARREAELRLAEVRGFLQSETGRAPTGRSWLLLVLAGATGVALAARRKRRPKRVRGSVS